MMVCAIHFIYPLMDQCLYLRSMHPSTIAESHKAEAARRQLGTALHLWLADLDPVSVHVLASGGCEIAEGLAKKVGKPFSAFSLEVHPDITESQLFRIRNVFWNALKHFSHKDGSERDDEELLAKPLESENEARLSAGWYDLMQVMPAPIEAQALTLWFIAKHGDSNELGEEINILFPDLRSVDSKKQKALLREKIGSFRNEREVMTDARTDTRPLIISA